MNVFFSSLKSCVLVFLVLLFFMVAPGQGSTSYDDRSGFELATEFINNGMFLEAVGIYQEIFINSMDADTRARALLFSGSVYDFYLDQPEAALKCFQEVTTLYPDTPSATDALFNSGRLLYKSDKFEKACGVFNHYLSKYPESTRSQSALAWIDKARGKIVSRPRGKKNSRKTYQRLDSTIRVLIEKNARRLVFNSPEKIQISSSDSGELLFYGKGPVVISQKNGLLAFNNINTTATRCKVRSMGSMLSLGGKRYRGRFEVLPESSGLSAVNHLHVEEYLYGVVPREMSWLWPVEALMAQAIASRTYALYIRDKQPCSRFYDLKATTDSQVYGGFDAEKKQTNKAVDNTRGKVMTFDGKLIVAYFHANSGGHTESSLNVWGVDLPYLQSVSDGFSAALPHNDWEYFLSYRALRKAFKKAMPKMGKIKKLKLEEKSDSSRIKSFLFITDKGDVRLSGNKFRLLIGPTFLKSTIFRISPGKKGILFKGTGYGHGVGMSQWGAQRMAGAGYSCKSILSHYYQGVRVTDTRYIQ